LYQYQYKNLTFNRPINIVCSKLKRLCRIFHYIRDYLNKENIKTIYYALVYSRIKYGITVYGQACNTKIKGIQTLQNQLLKVQAGTEYRFSTYKLYSELELLKVSDMKEQEILMFMHNFFQINYPRVQNLSFRELQNCLKILFSVNFAGSGVLKTLKDYVTWKIKSNAMKRSIFLINFSDLKGLKLLRKISVEIFGKISTKIEKLNFGKKIKIRNCCLCYLICSTFIFKWRQTPLQNVK